MKGLYIHTVYSEDQIREDTQDGIARKIYFQIKAFEDSGIQMESANPMANRRRPVYKLENRLSVTLFKPGKDIVDKMSAYDFIYVRNPTVMEKYVFELLMRIKEKNPAIVVLLEIPTYPYDHELTDRNKWNKKGLYENDRRIRENLYKCVDRIITFSMDEMIWDIPTIRISNAINYGKLRRTQTMHGLENSTIEVIACAQFRFWHGYDRALHGLAEYYDKSLNKNNRKEILLHIVGDSDELPKYKKFVAEKGLEEHVIFHGTLYGDDLKDVYERCVLGLDSMGRHRSGVFYNSSLKGKEYLAKGLLVVSGVSTELDYDEDYKYYFRVPADDTSVDFEKVVEWVDSLLKEETLEEIQNNIMEYARKNFDYGVSMKKIVEYLDERCGGDLA